MSQSSPPRRLIVSLTSYPARIQYVPQVLDTLLAQTRPADEIVLYLSGDQFPGRESDLPEALRTAASGGKLRLRFVPGDLRPHKKYFYAFRDYPDAYIVTVDDDALYSPDLLRLLWKKHLRHPGAVVAGRTHLITLDPSGNPNPYACWIRRTLGFEEGLSMQLFAVGVGGVLYDPRLFPPELLDEQAIRSLCLSADDLWLKAMELAAGIPVVRAACPELLRTIPGTQETCLYSQNLGENRNDAMFSAIRDWVREHYGSDLIRERLNSADWPRITDDLSLYAYLNSDRQRLIDSFSTAGARMEKQLGSAREEIVLLRKSRSYRLGNTLVAPFSRLLRRKK